MASRGCEDHVALHSFRSICTYLNLPTPKAVQDHRTKNLAASRADLRSLARRTSPTYCGMSLI